MVSNLGPMLDKLGFEASSYNSVTLTNYKKLHFLSKIWE